MVLCVVRKYDTCEMLTDYFLMKMSLCLLKGIFLLLLSFMMRNWQNEKNGLHCSDSALKSRNLMYFY